MDSQLIKDKDVVPMGEPNIQSPEIKKKKIIVISVVVALVLIIVITIILVFTLRKNEDAELKPLVFNSTSGNHTHTLIFMPGYSNQPEDFKKVFTSKITFPKKNDTTIVILRSPMVDITYNHTKNYAWYDIYGIPLKNLSDINFEQLKNSSKILEKAIENEVNLLNGNYENIIVGGHSQGASIALYQAYSGEKKLGGVFAFSGFLPPCNVSDDKNTLNAYLGYGDEDNVIEPSFINKSIENIKDFEGFDLHIYKHHKHHVCTNQTIDVSKFLEKIIK